MPLTRHTAGKPTRGIWGCPAGLLRARTVRSARSAAAVIGLLDELREGALEVLEHDVKVEDLVHADWLSNRHGFCHGVGLDALDLLDGAARDREHDDERHLALGTRDLQVEALLLVTEDLDIASLEAAPAYRAVVKPCPIADELDDAHRKTILRRGESPSAGPLCRCTPQALPRRNEQYRAAAPCGHPLSAPGAGALARE